MYDLNDNIHRGKSNMHAHIAEIQNIYRNISERRHRLFGLFLFKCYIAAKQQLRKELFVTEGYD